MYHPLPYPSGGPIQDPTIQDKPSTGFPSDALMPEVAEAASPPFERRASRTTSVGINTTLALYAGSSWPQLCGKHVAASYKVCRRCWLGAIGKLGEYLDMVDTRRSQNTEKSWVITLERGVGCFAGPNNSIKRPITSNGTEWPQLPV